MILLALSLRLKFKTLLKHFAQLTVSSSANESGSSRAFPLSRDKNISFDDNNSLLKMQKIRVVILIHTKYVLLINIFILVRNFDQYEAVVSLTAGET